MFALTESAAQAVEAIVSQPGLPDEAGLRIATTTARVNGGGPAAELELTVVAAPEPEDREIAELSLYLDPATVEFLDDKVLDAEIAGDEVRFSLHKQEA